MANKIDIHTHAIPEFFREYMNSLQEQGWTIPAWSVEGTKSMASKLGVRTSILSLSAPGPDLAKDLERAKKIARQANEEMADLVKSEPSTFGVFAAVPNPLNTEACLEEINYAFDTLHADGVTLFTQYSGRYLGDEAFEPVWRELDRRAAVVFVHPTIPEGYKPIASVLQHPASLDFPHESGRTAAHMVLTGMKRRYPNVKIILSHGGGTLPVLSERFAQLQQHLLPQNIPAAAPQTADEMVADAKTFWFDTALAGTKNVQDLLAGWAPDDRLLFGSDYPYCGEEAIYNARELEKYQMTTHRKEGTYWRNALELFPRLKQYY